MTKEDLILGIDLGNGKDNQCAVINLHYNDIDHIIYETHDKEQVEALNRIAENVNKLRTALTELKDIKEAKPSEAMERLERLLNCNDDDYTLGYQQKDHKLLRQSLLKAQEQEKENAEYKEVLKIIFKKNVNIRSLKAYDLEEYNMVYENKLTKEEFDLLKGMMK